MANAIKYGQVPIPGVPDDEPVFVLRAQDAISLLVIAEYRKMCMGAGCDIHHLEAIDTAYIAIRQWQQTDGHTVKAPDSDARAHNTAPLFASGQDRNPADDLHTTEPAAGGVRQGQTVDVASQSE